LELVVYLELAVWDLEFFAIVCIGTACAPIRSRSTDDANDVTAEDRYYLTDASVREL
jgi:hypothetical protein